MRRSLIAVAVFAVFGGLAAGKDVLPAPRKFKAVLLSSRADFPLAVSARDPRFRYDGRVDFSDPASPVVIWQGTTIQLEFSGERVAVRFGAATGQNYFDATVDDRTTLLAVPEGAGSAFELASPGGALTRHQLTLFKRSEAAAGTVHFVGVSLQQGAAAWRPARPRTKLRVEFLGDSITVGACDEDGHADQWTDRRTHNYAKSYACLTAEALGADERCIAVSGMGIAAGWVSVKAGEVWNRLYPEAGAPLADLSSWQPDILFVNLGENDASFPEAHGLPFPREAYVKGYVALVHSIRSAYPRAHLVLLRGGMENGAKNQELRAAWDRVVATVEARDAGISHFAFTHWTLNHPRAGDDRAMAGELLAWLRTQPFMARFR